MITINEKKYEEFQDGISILRFLIENDKKFSKKAIVAKVDGKLIDLSTPIEEGKEYQVFTTEDPEGLDTLRHSAAHIMAQAVKNIFDNVKVTIGPVIQDGFYYDFDVETPFVPADLKKIEKEMKKIVSQNLPFERKVMKKEDAIKHFESLGETYKVEIINDLPEGEEITFYQQGEFIDLCRGPHIPATSRLRVFKVLKVAGAYWRGDENNKMLQRVYATSFAEKSQLKEYLHLIEEAKKRDHRKLGKELDLFSFHKEGLGFPFWHPKGMIVRNLLIDFWREIHTEDGYDEILTPFIMNKDLWVKSGHYANYKDNMYFTEIDGEEHAVKPMNCPGGMMVYNSKMHSYKDLPVKLAELGTVHRHERSGTLHGLMRVRQFTQDDAHIFMLPEQITEEIKGVIKLIEVIYNKLGFTDFNVEISTRPEKFIGEIKDWDDAEASLKQALDELNYDYEINEADGAFYGPKIDFSIKDSLKREWQCSTIQLDFALPKRFECTYIGEDGKKHQPIMIHRALYGSLERLIGILIEDYAGKFPLWLAPLQLKIIPVSEKHFEYSNKVKQLFKNAGFRVEVNTNNETLGYKIRTAQKEKVPYMIILGDKEIESNNITVRSREKGDLGSFDAMEFLTQLLEEMK